MSLNLVPNNDGANYLMKAMHRISKNLINSKIA